jgi:hypothetical protein
MTADASAENALELVTRRLERALAVLDQRIAQKILDAGASSGAAFEDDRARLAAELDNARARERALEEAGAAASEALAGAIAEIRAALSEPVEP